MSDESKGLTKWQIAVLVGVGAAAVAGGVLLCCAVRTRRSRVNRTGETEPGSTSTEKGSTQTSSENGATSGSAGAGSGAQVRR